MNTIIEKIRAKIERLKQEIYPVKVGKQRVNRGPTSMESAALGALNAIMSRISTLKEQPVCEDVEHKNDIFEKAECWVSRNYPSAKGEEFDRLVTVYISGVAEGERRATEQMLKKAVEGEVVQDIRGVNRVKSFSKVPDWLYFGDKVKLIIVKEEGK